MKYLSLVNKDSMDCQQHDHFHHNIPGVYWLQEYSHIPGLLSVNADIYELSKEVFMSALFSTVVYLQYSQHACCISGNCGMGGGSLK